MLLGDFQALGFSGEIWTRRALSGWIRTPAALPGVNRTRSALSGDIWTLRSLRASRCRPKTC